MTDDACQCTGEEERRPNGSFFCACHQVWKTQHWRGLCQKHPGYRQAWREKRGPGQAVVGAPLVRPVMPQLTPAEADARLAVCLACKEYMGSYRCKQCELGCRNKFQTVLFTVAAQCPLGKWGPPLTTLVDDPQHVSG